MVGDENQQVRAVYGQGKHLRFHSRGVSECVVAIALAWKITICVRSLLILFTWIISSETHFCRIFKPLSLPLLTLSSGQTALKGTGAQVLF